MSNEDHWQNAWSRWHWAWPLALAVTLVLAYLPSLEGGFLNWDDPWLIERNTIVVDKSTSALGRILGDFSKPTRLILGAEYLPVRDVSLWLDSLFFGLDPTRMRVSNLAWYLGAVLLFRGVLLRVVGPGLAAELGAALFALGPVHVESVAWLAGRKDVLALFFLGAALFVYAKPGAKAGWVVGWVLLAGLSKSVAIVAPALLLALDLWCNRRPNWRILCASAGVAFALLLVHVWVGGIVGMTTPPPGGSRATAAMTMGPVWLRYLELGLNPTKLSVVQEVTTRESWDLPAALGWLVLFAWLGLGLFALVLWKNAKPLALFLFWVAPLVPVSQVAISLQNRMADRYLFLSVFALSLAVAWAIERWRVPSSVLACLALGASALFTRERARLFGDSELLFRHATHMTVASPIAPYQLAASLEAKGNLKEAQIYYQEVLRRSRDGVARRATNNLARIYANTGQLQKADTVLSRGAKLWPHDPKVLANWIRVLLRLGRRVEAEQRYTELRARFPDYDPEAEKLAPRVGP